MTHNLSSQQDQMGVRTVRRDTTGSSIKSLTIYQANRTRCEIRIVNITKNTAKAGV